MGGGHCCSLTRANTSTLSKQATTAQKRRKIKTMIWPNPCDFCAAVAAWIYESAHRSASGLPPSPRAPAPPTGAPSLCRYISKMPFRLGAIFYWFNLSILEKIHDWKCRIISAVILLPAHIWFICRHTCMYICMHKYIFICTCICRYMYMYAQTRMYFLHAVNEE